jgi:hypothetical protein
MKNVKNMIKALKTNMKYKKKSIFLPYRAIFCSNFAIPCVSVMQYSNYSTFKNQ